MDLRETYHSTGSRHPWELSRIRALRAIALVHGVFRPDLKVLDLGCGDGFIIDQLCADSGAIIDAVDIHLTADQVRAFGTTRCGVNFYNDYKLLAGNSYGLLTMFDVLEHVLDDVGFLRDIMARFFQPGALFFCTVPSFQTLFCAHDHFLGHHRRYTRSGLHQVLGSAGFRVRASGYLFASLLPARALMACAEKFFGAAEQEPGIGQWRGGRLMTSAITRVLDADNSLLIWLSRMGITVPGLTVWGLCDARQ